LKRKKEEGDNGGFEQSQRQRLDERLSGDAGEDDDSQILGLKVWLKGDV
jgi:hypothetical protein